MDSQLTDHPTEPGEPDNLFEPVPEDQGAHGDFGDLQHGRSPMTALALHRRGVAAATAAAMGFGAVGYGLSRRR